MRLRTIFNIKMLRIVTFACFHIFSAAEHRSSVDYKTVRRHLRTKGWAKIPGFLSKDETSELKRWATELPTVQGALHHYEHATVGDTQRVTPARTEDFAIRHEGLRKLLMHGKVLMAVDQVYRKISLHNSP